MTLDLWKLVWVRLEIVLVSVQDSCMVCADIPYAQKSFWTHPTVPLGDVAQVEAHFGQFGESANFDVR